VRCANFTRRGDSLNLTNTNPKPGKELGTGLGNGEGGGADLGDVVGIDEVGDELGPGGAGFGEDAGQDLGDGSRSL
jgi:hypothetical protein